MTRPENLHPNRIRPEREKEFAFQPPFKPRLVAFHMEEAALDCLLEDCFKKNSKIDIKWFWQEHVLKLEKGKSILTDYQKITRIA